MVIIFLVKKNHGENAASVQLMVKIEDQHKTLIAVDALYVLVADVNSKEGV